MSDEIRILRKLLWLRHGCPSAALCGDDGEMDCNACGIDFKRASAMEIENQFIRLAERQLRAAAEP